MGVQLGGVGVGGSWGTASSSQMATCTGGHSGKSRVGPEPTGRNPDKWPTAQGPLFLLLKLKSSCEIRAVRNDGDCPGVGSALRFQILSTPGKQRLLVTSLSPELGLGGRQDTAQVSMSIASTRRTPVNPTAAAKATCRWSVRAPQTDMPVCLSVCLSELELYWEVSSPSQPSAPNDIFSATARAYTSR